MLVFIAACRLSNCEDVDSSLVVVWELLIVVAFLLVVEHGLQWLQHAGFSGLGALELRLLVVQGLVALQYVESFQTRD